MNQQSSPLLPLTNANGRNQRIAHSPVFHRLSAFIFFTKCISVLTTSVVIFEIIECAIQIWKQPSLQNLKMITTFDVILGIQGFLYSLSAIILHLYTPKHHHSEIENYSRSEAEETENQPITFILCRNYAFWIKMIMSFMALITFVEFIIHPDYEANISKLFPSILYLNMFTSDISSVLSLQIFLFAIGTIIIHYGSQRSEPIDVRNESGRLGIQIACLLAGCTSFIFGCTFGYMGIHSGRVLGLPNAVR